MKDPDASVPVKCKRHRVAPTILRSWLSTSESVFGELSGWRSHARMAANGSCADRMGVRDSSCCPAIPAILRIGRTAWYDRFRKIDGATRRPVAPGVPGAERVYEMHEEMSRVWRN